MKNLNLILLLLFFICISISGQTYKKEKRIYIIDVTASMEGKGKVQTVDIFSQVKEQLLDAINEIKDDSTQIAIIPFTNKPHKIITGNTSNKTDLLNSIKSLTTQTGDTNIADAWSAGISQIDSTKVNYIFLLTDGLHNCGPQKEVLYSRLNNWAKLSKDKYFFAFYVMLTPNAKEMEITDIVNNTEKMWLIESMNINVTFINTGIKQSANINKDNKIQISFSSNNTQIFNSDIIYYFKMEDNPYYKISEQIIDQGGKIIEIYIEELKPRVEIPFEIELNMSIVYEKEKYPLIFFTPEKIKFNIINRGLRTIKIKEL